MIFRVERFALLERLPKGGISHDYRIDDPVLVKRKLVLPKDSHLLRPRHGTLFGVNFPRQDFHQRRLAGPVWPGDCVTPSRDKCCIYVFKEDAGAEAHRDIINR